ncbi:5-amino-6-(D-ribitylamino)uracil--L-tyrosine 4-hydroxyphenyl transferase CofH [Hwanghaeella sp. LZ110]|uniref:5-amino-6-(D-ribitylamino)uracil--L-tyrosine 4-hydroxyphenyl transferase CofH n=1 Tax=Hwanghaeella sp. LZ110 TaxID=3402810 RepID=UPI003B684B21
MMTSSVNHQEPVLSDKARTNAVTPESLLAMPDDALIDQAVTLRDSAWGETISYSRKVFIPLSQLCRDVCHYCTFAHPPKKGMSPYLTAEQVLDIARQGAAVGCREALFTLGDKPELRYRVAREALAEMGYPSTLAYLADMAKLVFAETGLLPHLNPGVMTAQDVEMLRGVSASMGIMLESSSYRLMEKGGCHYGSPDKDPQVRLETIAEAGRQNVPFTTGILIGIGETRAERLDALFELHALHQRYGHLQEIIVQNFRAKQGTLMSDATEPTTDELRWTIAAARVIFDKEVSIQAPPNLTPDAAKHLIPAGINDWGGVSPVTPDHVNPEAPWPHLDALSQETKAAGKLLVERLTVYPKYLFQNATNLTPAMRKTALHCVDSDGFVREQEWSPGRADKIPSPSIEPDLLAGRHVERILTSLRYGSSLSEGDVTRLFKARGGEFDLIREEADALRASTVGNTVRYVVTRNINYTNICSFKCQFCAFSKGKTSEVLRGKPYDLNVDDIAARAEEAWARGATEVCLQGGIHPKYTGDTYLGIVRAVREAVPGMHIHAFSPLEISQGASTLGLSVASYLERLRDAGLDTLPGTAAEILDDEVRAILCPDKLSTQGWLSVVETAHMLGLRTTSTIMFGHVDRPYHWARHLLRLRMLQERTGGITEFVPLPFVYMETPIYLKGAVRRGPTWRETLLMHAVSRLVLHPVIQNIQTSWVKLGPDGAAQCLASGANDMGGTLMNESISRAAGADFGQEMSPAKMEDTIRRAGRVPAQRTTLYAAPDTNRIEASFQAAELLPIS